MVDHREKSVEFVSIKEGIDTHVQMGEFGLCSSAYKSNQLTTGQVCSSLGIKSDATLYQYLRHEGINIDG